MWCVMFWQVRWQNELFWLDERQITWGDERRGVVWEERESWLTLTGAHVTAGLEEHGCLFVRANHTLLNLWFKRKKKKTSSLRHIRAHACTKEISEAGFYTLVLDWTCSLQMRHFLTRGEQREQVAIWPQGPKSVSLFISEHTIHSSRVSLLLFRDGLREPTCPLRARE